MQTENISKRPGGFIIHGDSAGAIKPKPKVEIEASKHWQRAVRSGAGRLATLLSQIFAAYTACAASINKRFKACALAFLICACCTAVFFKYFTFGISIYHNGNYIAITTSAEEYEKAAAVFSQRHENAPHFTLAPAIIIKAQKESSPSLSLSDKLLLALPDYKTAYSLCVNSNVIFSAETEEKAQKILDEYVSSFSMNGDIKSTTDYEIKPRAINLKEIDTDEQCAQKLIQSSAVSVVSVVDTSFEEPVPYETVTEADSSLYIGETVTQVIGEAGSKHISKESTYVNGLLQTEKVFSENIVLKPVTEVIRTGTKQKNILESGVIYPLQGTVSSPFGPRWGRNHDGIDIAVSVGTDVKAAECGTVSYVSEDAGGYGKLVRIDHGYGMQTAYAHLDKIEVTVGQNVKAVQCIAKSGNTGRSTCPHLHFEIIKDGTQIDPQPYMHK